MGVVMQSLFRHQLLCTALCRSLYVAVPGRLGECDVPSYKQHAFLNRHPGRSDCVLCSSGLGLASDGAVVR